MTRASYFLALAVVMSGAQLSVAPAVAADLPPVIDLQNGESAITSPQADESTARTGGDKQMLVDMFRRLETMQQEVRDLRGQFEEQSHQLEGIRQRQRDLYVDIDNRLRKLETAGAGITSSSSMAGTRSPPMAAPPATAATGAGAVMANAAQEQAVYEQAFGILKDRHYDDAITAFRDYLTQYPNGSYADNAQYWIGEANYVLRRFPAAIEEFKKVTQNYPDSSKVADSLVKIGFSYYELQEWSLARQTLEKLVADYPDTTAARLGQQRLQKMKLEGR